ncbi:hypothetical protein JAAARDRAFT_198477 [Jaapia argillacea MUCL 33604]|uniref:Uncharacterized protein n=1 Tax=Jaapia argillacea MUCL 33604 TaxID=933084 RepID=A0A067PBL0_9AGAM|nr:hypothetical protein JAAARDRAFT_198477 [Jaapia argillacea MUCL 33604]
MSSTTLDSSADTSYDPLKCLSDPNFDPSDPPLILLFVYHTLRQNFVRIWAVGHHLHNMIRGHSSVADTWILWRPGDEEWLRSNLRRDGDGWRLEDYDWKEAQKEYRRRVDRLAGRGVSDLWPASVKERIWKADTPTRASAIAWLILISPFVTQCDNLFHFKFHFSSCINKWICASGNLLPSLGLPIQPLTGFVEMLPDSGHTCSFWDSSASSWASLFSWLYNYHDYRILISLCNDKLFFPSGKDGWIRCDVCWSVRKGLPYGPLPWVLDPKVRQNQPRVWQIILLLASRSTAMWSSLDDQARVNLVNGIVFNFDHPVSEYLPMLEWMIQNQEIHQPDPHYDIFINRFPPVWRPTISSFSCTLDPPYYEICDLDGSQCDLQTPISVILWIWVERWGYRYYDTPVCICIRDRIFEWRRLLFTDILPALQISSSAPFNPIIQKFLSVLRML